MGEKINIDGNFTGTVEFMRFDFVGKNETPTLKIVCTDNETGRSAWGDMWCSLKAIAGTANDLRGMGVEGATDSEVIDNFSEIGQLPCEFQVEQNGEYFNAKFPRGIGVEAKPSGKVAQSDWHAKVFGNAAPADPPSADGPEPF